MILQKLEQIEKIHPPPWLVSQTQLLVKMGSHAYGIATDDSDVDLYGFAIPPIQDLLPHTRGEIMGFGKQLQRFEQYTEDHISHEGNEYDISIYNIAKFLQLCMLNNPNMIDALFVPNDCIIHLSTIGALIRQNRRKFLHKGCYHKFLGYAHSQLKKIKNKNPEGKRKAVVDKFGFDTKYASHLYRLADECEQILTTGDLDLRKCRRKMQTIRDGEVSLSELEKWFEGEQVILEQLYKTSDLRHSPDEKFIKGLLVRAIEIYHGRLEKFTFGCRS